ncbi:AGE family epimerase/isomerase, partial [Bacillus subtilis]|nr:AGE family epimerase/isomerase [Bacillus subtilis]
VWEHYHADWSIDWDYNKEDSSNIFRPWGFQPGHQTEWAKLLLILERHRPLDWLAPRAAAAQASAQVGTGDIALVFGNERTGLANEHVEQCSALAHIPATPAYSSLNLAQAVQELAYELRVAFLEQASEPS